MAVINRPDLLKATEIQEILRWMKHTTDNVDAVNAPQNSRLAVCCKTAFNVPTGTVTALPFDSTLWTSDGELQLATLVMGGYGIYCARDGYVQANFTFEAAAGAGGNYRKAYLGRLRTTSSDIFGQSSLAPSAGATWGASGAGLIEVQAGDILQVFVQQDSGGNLALTVSGQRSRMDAFYVAFT